MLSYMLPVDEKPPPAPPKSHGTHHNHSLQLSLAHGGSDGVANGRSSAPISKETSVSSFASDATTATASHSSMTTPTSTSDKGKPKLVINGAKHPTLKRLVLYLGVHTNSRLSHYPLQRLRTCRCLRPCKRRCGSGNCELSSVNYRTTHSSYSITKVQ